MAERKSIPTPPPEDRGPGIPPPPPDDAPWQDKQIWEANQALRLLLEVYLEPKLSALKAREDYYRISEIDRETFNLYREALHHLLHWPPHISLPLAHTIQFIQIVAIKADSILMPPPKPPPLSDRRKAPWSMVRQWMIWYYHYRNPYKDIDDETLAKMMGRGLSSIEKYKKRYKKELAELGIAVEEVLEMTTR